MTSLGVYYSSVTKSDGSFRTTIPQPIAKALELEHKDKMSWELTVDEKFKKYAIVRSIRREAPQHRGAKKAN